MPRTRPPYSPEFRRQMVDLVRAGRSPDDLAREFEPSGHSIRAWVAQADRNEGRREEAAPDLTAFERDELTRLRRETPNMAAWVGRKRRGTTGVPWEARGSASGRSDPMPSWPCTAVRPLPPPRSPSAPRR